MNTVLITGAGRGIGFALANRMSALGWNVISTVHSMSSRQGPLPGMIMAMDVTDLRSVQSAAKKVHELDVLINNAIFTVLAEDIDVLTVSIDLVQKTLNTNILGSLRVAQEFLPTLLRSRTGRIVNVSSIRGQLTGAGEQPPTLNPAYSMSKAGLNMLTGLLAASLKFKGISVNSVCPSGGRSVEAAADEIIWAATEVGHDQTGKFFHNRQSIVW